MTDNQIEAVARTALERISKMCPATQEMSVAHEMAAEADDALAAITAHNATLVSDADGLVGRLRTMAPDNAIVCKDRTTREMCADIRQAADTIEALRAEVARLTGERDMLEQTSMELCDQCGWAMKCGDGCYKCRTDAALAGEAK